MERWVDAMEDLRKEILKLDQFKRGIYSDAAKIARSSIMEIKPVSDIEMISKNYFIIYNDVLQGNNINLQAELLINLTLY